MRKILFCLVLMAGSASAAPIITTQTFCGSLSGCSADAGAYFASVTAEPPPGIYSFNDSFSASASFQDEEVFTVTAGPQQGFFAACFSGEGDTFNGNDTVQAGFGGSGAPPPPMRAFSFQTCGTETSFTLGVPIDENVFFSASVSTSGPYPQAFADINFTGFQFFDASQNPVLDVTYSLDEATAVFEPCSASLLLFGLLLWASGKIIH